MSDNIHLHFVYRNEAFDLNLVKTDQPSPQSIRIDGVDYSVDSRGDDHSELALKLLGFHNQSAGTGTITIEGLRDRLLELTAENVEIKIVTAAVAALPEISGDVTGAVLDRRRESVENGLMPRFHIPGTPMEPVNIVQRMKELGVPGVNVAVINDGRVEWTAGYGELAEGDKLIQAASISKTVTALTVLSLIDQCRQAVALQKPSGLARDQIIDLDTNVREILGEDIWRNIDPHNYTEQENSKLTIRRLLSHTGGTTVSGFMGYSNDGAELPTLDEMLLGGDKSNSVPVTISNPPGTHFEYSGGGTTILQKVIELLTEKTFAEAASERVLNRLEMKDSTYTPEKSQVVHGNGGDSKPIEGDYQRYPELAAAGLWTTPSDLAKIVIEIQSAVTRDDGKVLSRELAREMLEFQTGALNTDEDVVSGLGVFIEEAPSSVYFSHGGSNKGFRCHLVANDKGQGAVVMTNSEYGNFLTDELLPSIGKTYEWHDLDRLDMSRPIIQSVDSEVVLAEDWAENYVGTYYYEERTDKYHELHEVEVNLSDGKIFAKVDENPPMEVFPLTAEVGCFRIADPGPMDLIRFKENSNGTISLILYGAEHKRKDSMT